MNLFTCKKKRVAMPQFGTFKVEKIGQSKYIFMRALFFTKILFSKYILKKVYFIK